MPTLATCFAEREQLVLAYDIVCNQRVAPT